MISHLSLAADYLLQLMTSRIFDRSEHGPIGMWTMNISGFGAGDDSKPVSQKLAPLYATLAKVMPCVAPLSLTIDSLQKGKWKVDFSNIGCSAFFSPGSLLLVW